MTSIAGKSRLLLACLVTLSAASLLLAAVSMSNKSSTPVQLITIDLPRNVKVGESFLITGLVRDPLNPQGPFGLPSANITVTVRAPDGGVETLTQQASMMGSWQVTYTAKKTGVHFVQVRAENVSYLATAEFTAE